MRACHAYRILRQSTIGEVYRIPQAVVTQHMQLSLLLSYQFNRDTSNDVATDQRQWGSKKFTKSDQNIKCVGVWSTIVCVYVLCSIDTPSSSSTRKRHCRQSVYNKWTDDEHSTQDNAANRLYFGSYTESFSSVSSFLNGFFLFFIDVEVDLIMIMCYAVRNASQHGVHRKSQRLYTIHSAIHPYLCFFLLR